MSAYLIQGILVAKELVLCEIYWVLFALETFELLGSKILTPTSWMVPMRAFKNVLGCLINNLGSNVVILIELLSIAGLMTAIKSTSFKVCDSHAIFFFIKIKSVTWWVPILRVLSLGNGHLWWLIYEKKIVMNCLMKPTLFS